MNLSTKFFLFLMILLSSNFVLSQTNKILLVGDIEGHVFNGDGLTIAGASVGVDGWGLTTSDAAGYYLLTGLPEGDNDVVCHKEGYNTVTEVVVVPSGGIITHDFTLTQPNLTISPLFFDETLNPNEYFTTFLGILNTGDGDGGWTAVINYPSKGTSSNAINVTGQPYPVSNNTGNESPELAEQGGKPLDPSDATLELFECNPESLFGNSPVGSNNAYLSQYGGSNQVYQQVNGVTETWTTVTFWGIFTSGTPVTEDFFIGIYDDDGSTYGSEIASYILPLDPISTGEILLGTYPIYQWIAVIDEQNTSDFWISCQATSQMYWLQSPTGTGNSTAPSPLAVCIEGDPTANWLTLDEYEGTVPANGGSQNIGVNLDASGTVAGEVYTAEIVITTDPDVGTFNIPVTMTIEGDALCYVTDLEAEYLTDVIPIIEIRWCFYDTCGPTFQYLMIQRDGIAIGTTNQTGYVTSTDHPPDWGDYCYTIVPVYDFGNNGGSATTCVEWEIPQICWTPNSLYNEQWINTQEEVILEIENCNEGTLSFMFPDYISSSRFACDMQVALYDSYGDGWNGGSLDVFVNGNLVLDDITLDNGTGPEYFTFPAESGDDISTIYTAGQWPYENWYEFYDGDGNLIYTSGDVSIPVGVVFGTCPQPSYITDVEPVTGLIPSGETMDITITYDATGFPVGLYDEWLKIETNDPLYQEDSIFNQMLVYSPAMYYGYVHDCNTGLPMAGVEVTAYGGVGEDYSATTNALGYYEFYVDEDVYDVYFSMLGFESVFVAGVFAQGGEMTEISICMSETPYPVGWVFADPNEVDNECLVTWSLPTGPYEIIYDDGGADDYAIWALPGGAVGVHFTPVGYPATVLGGRLYVGDGSFPLGGGNFLGTQIGISIMDDDGVNGLPGTMLDSVVYDVNNYGWVDFYGIFSTIIEEGDFYIIMWQGYGVNAAPIGIDTDPPTVYRSVVKPPGSGWMISPYQDFMIRAYVSGSNAGVMSSNSSGKQVRLPKVTEGPYLATSLPACIDGTVKHGEYRTIENLNSSRSLVDYTVALITDFDPDLGPQTGMLTSIANTTDLDYLDQSYGSYDEGFYAYAVKANYESNESEWTYSNTVPHLLYNEVTIVVSLCNDGELENSEVAMWGFDYPYELFQGNTDTNGIVVFDNVIDGLYELFVSKVGYISFGGYMQNNTYYITTDTTIGVELIQKMYPPTNLEVDPLTSVATWDEPLITQLYLEDFEDPTFPPLGWQATTIDAGWFRSEDASSGGWTIPPGDGFYAVTNDDAGGSTQSTEDYLITPMMDLRESEDFALYFSSFYDGTYGFNASIEYSYDNGANWDLLETVSPNGEWVNVSVDLSLLSGSNSLPVWLAFHGDDNGNWASGWAVDNVEIKNGPAPVLAYDVFLNNEFLAQTSADETTYTFVDLIYGQTYETCVFAIYDCGSSDLICTTWESVFLQPPRNLTDEYTYGTNEVLLMWNPPITETNVPDGLVSFNLYRDSINITNIPYEGQGVDDWITYIDNNLDPNPYVYYVSAEYDLDIFGYPGEFGESEWNGPDTVDVVWGSVIPFFEGWDNGTFSFQNWTFNENSENWAINSQQGDPEPSAEFTWDPLLENNYSATLTSFPIIVDYLTEGELFLSFDLKLEDRNSTGDEKMLIEIYDGTTWHLGAEFSNSGKFSFTTNIINITDYASGNTINIRFNATGQNSFDIISWFVDNINIYRECEAPTDLTGTDLWDPGLQQWVAEVCWESPVVPGPLSEWIHWDSGETGSAIGLTDGGTFSVAARWDAGQLVDYVGTSITKMQYVPLEGFTSIILKIWIGADAESLIYEEDVTATAVAGSWNELTLTAPILLDVNEELWVGYTITHSAGTHPAGTDYGPAIASYGDMITTDGSNWNPLSSFGLNYNWNVQLFVTEVSSSLPAPMIDKVVYNTPKGILEHGEINPELVIDVNSDSRDITSFNIYRMVEGATEYELYDVEDCVTGQTPYCYFDVNVGFYDSYYYKVTANYISETDACESAPAMAYEIPTDDFVYILFEGIEGLVTLTTNVYPNPAKDMLTVTSSVPIKQLSIIDYIGHTVYTSKINKVTSIELNTSSFKSGAYLVKIETEKGIITKRVIVNR